MRLLSFLIGATAAAVAAAAGTGPRAASACTTPTSAGLQALQDAAIAHRGRGELDAAQACFASLAKEATHDSHKEMAFLQLGEIAQANGDVALAAKSFNIAAKAGARLPESRPEPLFRLGNLHKDVTGNAEEAMKAYERLLAAHPSHAGGANNLGLVYRSLGRSADAERVYLEAIERTPSGGEPYVNLAFIYSTQGRNEDAESMYRKAMALRPDWPEMLYNFGTFLVDIGREPEAVRLFERVIELNATVVDLALSALGNSHSRRGNVVRAAELYRRAAAAAPDKAMHLNSLGSALRAFNSPEKDTEALQLFERALTLDPANLDANVHLANVYNAREDFARARKYLARALEIDPNSVSARSNLGDAYRNDGMYLEAIPNYERAFELDPTFDAPYCNLVYAYQFISDWDKLHASMPHLVDIMRKQVAQPVTATTHICVHPFMAIAYPLPMDLLRDISGSHGQLALVKAESHVDAGGFDGRKDIDARRRRPGPLRIGFSGFEFGNFPVGKDLANVFASHESVEAFVYCFNHDDGSPWYTHIRDAVGPDHFRQMDATSTDEVIRRVRADDIDVLISLSGYTKGERNEVFALRAAPVQVFFKGFAGTSGAPFVDYTVSDRVAIPPQLTPWYSERIGYMDDSFFISDHAAYQADVIERKRPFVPKRADYGLRDGQIVYCSFNQLYKIDAETFDTWMRILARVDNSVLWLLKFPAVAEPNVRREAERRGIDGSRLIFSDKYPDEQHLKIKALADVYLDTPLYNGHGTTTDILWAGVPAVTFPRTKLSARVAASLVAALGTPETIVDSMDAYEELAVALGNDPARLAALRRRVEDARLSSSLFDVTDWVRRWERTLHAMYEAKSATGKALHTF